MLVQKLPDGPLDIVGDVHGELAALHALLEAMGYSADGGHPEGRQLVFVGDLTDRGPDSPGVVDFVDRLIADGRGYCVLGNHDLNLLLGQRKYDNGWFFGEPFEYQGHLIPQQLADDAVRAKTISLFERLPIALERPGLRIVHAYWDTASIEAVRGETNVVKLLQEQERRITTECRANATDKVDTGLRHQNDNPVKLLTSGPEQRVDTPFEASGKLRYEERVKWWEEAGDTNNLTVFGHYSLSQDIPRTGSAVCCDYGVAKRYQERIAPGFTGSHNLRLGAIRIPERVIVFDDGTQQEL